MLVTGKVIDERYEILQHLGDGGMGSVFKACEIGLERTLAIKVLHASHLQDPESRERFRREGVLLSRLNHENIMRCYRLGIWEQEGLPYIAMEFLDGIPLNRLLAEQTQLSPQYVLSIAQQLCAGMSHAHKHDIVHRDIKPANIMIIREEGREDLIKILDFGLAGLMHNSDANHTLTQTGELIGSIYYMSPEQCVGKRADERADIYSVGCVLYEVLTGAPPLVTDNPVGMMHLHSNVYPLSLEEKLSDTNLPPGLNSVLMKAMAKDVDLRYQTMPEFGEALSLVEKGMGASITPFVPDQKGPARIASGMNRLFLSGLIVLAGLTALSIGYRFENRKQIHTASQQAEQAVLIPYNLLKCYGLKEQQLDPEQIEAWIKKYGRLYLHDKIHATWLLYCANRITADVCFESIKKDLKQILLSPSAASDREPYFRTVKLFLAIIQRRDGRAGSVEKLVDITEHKIDDETMNRVRRDLVEALRWAGLYDEEEKTLRMIKPYAARDYVALASCLNRQGKLKDKERQSLLRKFDGLASSASNLEEGFVAGRALMELNELDRALKFTSVGLEYGQFELAYYALIHSLLGHHRDADEILQNPAMYDYRLPIRVWNSREMSEQVKRSVLQDIKDKTHDYRALMKIGYCFFESSPLIATAAIENCAKRLHAEKFAVSLPNASLFTELLIHVGQVERARKFAEEKLAQKPRGFTSVHFEEISLRLQYGRVLRLQGETDSARKVLATILEKSRKWPSAQPFCEPLILAEMGLNEQAAGRLDSAQSDFERSLELCRDDVAVNSVDKVLIAEAFARLCIEKKDYAKASQALALSNKWIPCEQREAWQTWIPLCPDYNRLRVITDKDF